LADVFISYSRADGAFVRELHSFLIDRGKNVWVDWEDIPPASQWEQDIDDNIDAADSFVFVISGSSLASQYCAGELRHAGERGKRIVPIACDGADPAQAPEGLRQLNWIWCRTDDERSAAFAKVLDALDTDLGWARAHTRLLVRAVEWDARRDSSLLLRGRDLEDAQEQLAANAGKEPVPTELQREYVLASRRASTRRQRVILGSVSLALLVSVSLGVVALLQRNSANERARIARSQVFAAQAVGALDSEPAAALADAVKAMETHRTPEARVALRRAILANPVAYAIPAAGKPRGWAAAGADALTFSDDGRLLVGLTPDHMLRVWRSDTGRPATVATRATTFAQHGRLLLVARRREARILDLRTGAVLDSRRVPRGRRLIGVGFSRGVPRAAEAVRGRVVIQDVRGRDAVSLKLRSVPSTRVLFSPESDRVVTLTDDGEAHARVWDARSGRLLATLPVAFNAAISQDGRFVATIGYGDEAALWSVGRRARTADLGRADAVWFGAGGKLVLAVGDTGGVGVWRSATGAQVAAFPGFGALPVLGGSVTSTFAGGAALSHDGSLVALANADGNVRIWDVATRKQVGAVPAGWANALVFAPRGRGRMLAAMAWNGEVVVARTPTSVPLRTHYRPNSCVPDFGPAVSSDGRHVLARAAEGAVVWTVDGRRVRALTPPGRPAANRRSVGSAAFSGDGKIVAAAGAGSGCVRSPYERFGAAVWRLGRRTPLREMWFDGPITLDTQGRLVAVGGGVWRTAGGERLRGLGQVLVLSPRGAVALVFRDGRLQVVETGSDKTVAALRDAGPLVQDVRDDFPIDASFSPDGRRLLTNWRNNARLWDATTGEPIALLGRKGEEVDDFAFGDGGRLTLATFPDRAAVFSAADGKLLSSVPGPFDGGVVFSNGELAAVPKTDGGIDIVDIATGTRVTLQTDTALPLTTVSFGPTADSLVARDEQGDVHVVSCEICASEDELLTRARSRLAVLSRIEAKRPQVAAVG
jgi:WD40 repeat protein